MTERRSSRALAGVGALVGVSLLIVGALVLASKPRAPAPRQSGEVPRGSVGNDVPSSRRQLKGSALVRSPSRPPSTVRAVVPSTVPVEPSVAFLPEQLEVDQLGLRVPIVAVGTNADGSVILPSDVHRIAWWRGGAEPGTTGGTVVLAGHVDAQSQGRGALFDLRLVKLGARVRLNGPGGRADYQVVAVRQLPKALLPADLFQPGGPPRLAIVTCAGPFDEHTHHYRDNLVVYAVPS